MMMPKPSEALKLTKMLQFDQFFIWKHLKGTANVARIYFSKRETYTVTAIVCRKRLFKKKRARRRKCGSQKASLQC